MIQRGLAAVAALCGLAMISSLGAANPGAVERGERALLGRAFTGPAWAVPAYKNVWRRWNSGLKEAPQRYEIAIQERYGLPPAPYANGDYPMGLREASGFLSRGITVDCLLCHGGSIAGQSIIGLGNASLDIQALFEEMAAVSGGFSPKLPFTFSNVRGTSEAGAMAAFTLSLRDPDLTMRTTPLDLCLRDDLCDDVPAWWLVKK